MAISPPLKEQNLMKLSKHQWTAGAIAAPAAVAVPGAACASVVSKAGTADPFRKGRWEAVSPVHK